MTDIERLHETIQQLSYENAQLSRFKKINRLMLEGLDAILCSENHDEVFARLFDVISNILPCDQILIAQHDVQQSTVVPVCRRHDKGESGPLRFCDLTNFFDHTVNLSNVNLVPDWQSQIGKWLPEATSVLIHPINTAQAEYIWLISECQIGAFSKQYEEVFVSFSAFVANTLSQFEKRSLMSEKEALLAERARIERSMIHQEKMAALGQLAAGVAHELNNPLGFINSNLSSLHDYVSRIEQFARQASSATSALESQFKSADLDYILTDTVDLVDESLDGMRRATDIIQNLKAFSHPDEKTTKSLDFLAVIRQALTIVRTQAKNIVDIYFDTDLESATVNANANQLAQVIINIVTNAIQAVNQGSGQINIAVTEDSAHIECRIKDNGTGIDEKVQASIFDPFFTTKAVGLGTGLGLSISRAIIEQYSGELLLESTGPTGTCFLIRLPLINEA